MALIVEDGTGKPDAEAFCDIETANAYFSKRGNSLWAGEETELEAALRSATDYMQAHYAKLWRGCLATTDQGLDWPRAGVKRDDGRPVGVSVVPQPVVFACAELAVRALAGELTPDGERAESEVKIGPLEIKYEEGESNRPVFVSVNAMLAPLMKASTVNGGYSGRIVRT